MNYIDEIIKENKNLEKSIDSRVLKVFKKINKKFFIGTQ